MHKWDNKYSRIFWLSQRSLLFNQGEEQQISDTDESEEEAEANGHVHNLSEPKDVTTVVVGPDPDTKLPGAIILDLSPVNFLDTVGVKTLRNVRHNLYSVVTS